MIRKRVLLVASAGGHWVQLSRLSPAFDAFDTYYVTTMQGATAPSGQRAVATVPDASRSTPLRFAGLLLRAVWILLSFRPHVVVTTGAAPGLVILQLGKLLRCRTIWIDSLANSEELSLSGRFAKRYADLWLTQWPHLADTDPKLQYYGAVL